MQRRAAAIYFVLFLVVGVAAYAYIGVAQETQHPQFNVEGTHFSNDTTKTINGTEYTARNIHAVAAGGGHGGGGTRLVGTLEWTNTSARFTASLSNNSTHAARQLRFDGMEALYTARLAGSDTVRFNGSTHEVELNATSGQLTLVNASNASLNTTFAVGDTVPYRNNQTTLIEVTDTAATLEWGDSYRVHVANESNVSSFQLRQQYNVTAMLQRDAAVYNQTVTINGTEYVTYRANDTNVRLSSYLPAREVATFTTGDSLQYQGNDTTVSAISPSGVTLAWTGNDTRSVEITEGANITLADGQGYFAHYVSDEEFVVAPDSERPGYAQTNARIAYFNERVNGLWGVVLISLSAAILLLGTALLPVRG